MRSLEILIAQARLETDNSDYSTTAGLQQQEFIQAACDAQDHLQSAILIQKPEGVFEKATDIRCSSGVEAYPLPFDAYLKSRVVSVHCSPNGIEREFYPIKQVTSRERYFGVRGTPTEYLRQGTNVILQPIPNSSGTKIRVIHKYKIPRLDLRRATVGAVVLGASSITSLTLDTSADLDRAGLVEENYFTVVDKNGAVKMRRIAFTDIDESTGVVTIDPGFAFESGESIAVGDFLVRGPWSTTHSELADECERYLVTFMKLRALHHDSSNDELFEDKLLMDMEADILGAFADADDDVDGIPIISDEFTDTFPY